MEINGYPPLADFLIDLLLDAVCVVGGDGRFVFVSAACERIFGYTPEEMIGKPMIDFVFHEDRERTLNAAGKVVGGHLQLHFENRYVRKNGEVAHIMWSARRSEDGQLRIAVARDVTERKQAESMQAALYEISEAAHVAEDPLALFQLIHQIIGKLLPARNFSVAMYEEGSEQLSFPYHVDEYEAPASRKPATGTLCADVIRTRQPLLLRRETLAALPEELRAPGGKSLLCWLDVPLNSPKGIIGALVLKSYSGGASYSEKDKELLQFVSTQIATAIERKQLQARLQHMAQYDGLTGLPNRGLLHDRLEHALKRARREKQRMGVLYLDLEKFKQVNDTLGHAAGDLLLQEVARRLEQCLRDGDTVARMGGDEFVVLLEDIQVPEHAAIVAEKIHSAISQPINMEGRSLRIQPSIGIAIYPEHGDGVQRLLKHADEAMYLSKKRGIT
jgi:diguanylate cyclase (GGDEF)-like protein/PAS domain S-box-containing protein